MGDSLITVVVIGLAAILMFVFPLATISEMNDNEVLAMVQSYTTEFVNKIRTKGKITRDDYNAYVQKLHATGNSYEIEMETKILDENPGKKTTTASQDMIGENVYYSEYTTVIEDKLLDPDGDQTYYLKKGDYITVTVKNTNITMGTQLKNFFYKLVGKDTYTIGATVSTLVTNTGNGINN